MNRNAVVILGALGLVGGILWLKSRSVSANFTDPDYMKGDMELPEVRTSSNNTGGNLDYTEGPVAVDYPTFTSGTFLHPEFLPPVRTTTIGAGRIIHPGYLS
ncbi:MAG: hypothetical protein PHC43_00165 [Candidatus Marinimicrobia bacterium]|jgi:hypothetical protein|nr:hypothetical protein [Candidatus Neomarinimicrobiota bacterium]